MSETVIDGDSREAFKRLRLSMECDQCHKPFVLMNLVLTEIDVGMGFVRVEAKGNTLGRSPLRQYKNPVSGELVYICPSCVEEYSGEKRTG